MAIQLLGFPTTLGLPRTARRHAPEAMRTSGLIERLESMGHQVIDHGDLSIPPGRTDIPVLTLMQQFVEAARGQKELWLEKHQPGDLMLTIGGDHSTSLGTIWALAAQGHQFDVIWVDAHGDANIIETSPTGRPHGMVLSTAMGWMPDLLGEQVKPERLHLWGVRDLDPGEDRLLRAHHVEILTPEQVRAEGEQIVKRLGPNIFLSFDIDSVDPSEAPGTMVPVPGGFTRKEALDLVAAIVKERNLLALDLVEYHPDYDPTGVTEQLAFDVITTVLEHSTLGQAGSLRERQQDSHRNGQAAKQESLRETHPGKLGAQAGD